MENSNEERLTNAQGVVHTIVTKKTLYIDKKGQKFLLALSGYNQAKRVRGKLKISNTQLQHLS